MTLAKRIIPTLLVKGRTLVKGQRFDAWRSIGHALQGAKVHAKRGVDEIILLDISATAEGRGPDLEMVRELTSGCFIPVTVGGGVRTLQDIDALLRAGADKVALCTELFAPASSLLEDASARFGRQAIVACVEYRHVEGMGTHVTHHCGRMAWTLSPLEVAKAFDRAGAGEIFLSSIDRDGTMAGYDLDLIREVSQAVSVPVIASGGCSGYSDMLAAFKAGADACAAGALFSFTEATPRGAAQYLKSQGMEVRV